MLAECASGHRRTLPFRLLKTHDGDATPIYGRPFLCRACGSRSVTLFAIDDHAELQALRRELDGGESGPAEAPTNYRRPDLTAELP